MRIDRPIRSACLSLTFAVGVAWTIAGCGSGDGTSAEVSPEAQKKVQTMLTNMPNMMKEKKQAEAATKKAEAAARRKGRTP